MHRFAKPACWDNRHRGFESRPLRFSNFSNMRQPQSAVPTLEARGWLSSFVIGVDSIPLVGVFSVRFVCNSGSHN